MRRSCSALFLIVLASAYCEAASAQAAPPSSAPAGAAAAPSAPAPAAPNNASVAPPATPSAPAAAAPSSAPPVAAPATQSPAGSSSPAPSTAVPATPVAPAPGAEPAAPRAGDANAGGAAGTGSERGAAQTQVGAEAARADSEATTEPEPQGRPSFLDAHPPGYLPSLYNPDIRAHRGFAVRISAGLGYGIMRRRVTDSSSYKVRGLEGQLSLDVGASVIDNLILFGRFSGFAWNSLLESDSRNAGGAYLGLLGAGARYYLMPANAFASAAIGVAALQVLNDLGVAQNANPGFGMELEVGKDFWAGTPLDQRSIGLSLRFGWVHCGSVARGDEERKPWNSYSISVLFSAAYN